MFQRVSVRRTDRQSLLRVDYLKKGEKMGDYIIHDHDGRGTIHFSFGWERHFVLFRGLSV